MQVEKPFFTVATITYNSSKWVRQAIESILNSSYSDFELLISDDCSTDDTWNIIQEYQDPRINSWQNNVNIGEYSNRNKILDFAKGKYILYVDGDDILYKNTLRNLSEYILEFPECGIVFGVLTPTNPFVVLPYVFEPIDTLRIMLDPSTMVGNIGFAETLFNVIALRNVGGFSTEFKMGDIFIRKKLSLSNNTLFVPLGFMHWRVSENQASKIANKHFNNIKEEYFINVRILNDKKCPLNQVLVNKYLFSLKINLIKWMVKNLLYKLRVVTFFEFSRKMKISILDFKLLFLDSEEFKFDMDTSNPLHNDFNFS